jgi:hypothetical protein
MGNLNSVSNGQAVIRELTRAVRDETGNLPPMPEIFPDYPARHRAQCARRGRRMAGSALAVSTPASCRTPLYIGRRAISARGRIRNIAPR